VAEPNPSTQSVIERHLELTAEGDIERDLQENYSPEVAFLKDGSVERGHEARRRLNACLERELPDMKLTIRKLIVDGEVALLEWTAKADGSCVEDGIDSFVVRDGKITAHTISYTVKHS
jgi:hypothetical protein